MDFVSLFPTSVRFKLTKDLSRYLLGYKYKDFNLLEELKDIPVVYDALLKLSAEIPPDTEVWGLVPLNLSKRNKDFTGLQFLKTKLKEKESVDPYGIDSILRIVNNDTAGSICQSCPRVLHRLNGDCSPFTLLCATSLNLSVPSYFLSLKEKGGEITNND
jgi:hypothetical protein